MYRFKLGQIVHHRRYDYRGVIAAADPQCFATNDWYRRNMTQPAREQPWYHVLVDGGHETYVAEENLEIDSAGAPVDHPLVARVFAAYVDGEYAPQSLN